MQSQETAPILNADAERMLLAKYLTEDQLEKLVDGAFERQIELQDGRKERVDTIVYAYRQAWVARMYQLSTDTNLPRDDIFDVEYAKIVASVDAVIAREYQVSEALGDALIKLLAADEVRLLRQGTEPVPDEPLFDIHDYASKIANEFRRKRHEIEALIVAEVESMRASCEPSDELWTIRSRYVGPLAGYRGYGLVRDGRVTKHKVMIRY